MKINEEALRDLGVELVMLFGSHARNQAGPNSDLDLAVQFAPGTDSSFEKLDEVRNVIDHKGNLDLVSLNSAPPLLLKEVATDGQVQFESKPGTVERFRLRAFKIYMDTAKFRKLQSKALRTHYG